MSTFFIDKAIFDIDWVVRHLFGKSDSEAINPSLFREGLHSKINEHIQKELGNELTIGEYQSFISRKDFLRHLRASTPFVIRGGAKLWPAVEKWDFDFLSQTYPDVVVPLVDNNRSGGSLTYDTLKNAISVFKNGGSLNCKFSDLLYHEPRLQSDLRFNELENLKPAINIKGALQFFIGPEATKTVSHCAIGHNFFSQIRGEKLWHIYPRKYSELFMPKITRSPHFIADERFSYPNEREEIIRSIDYWKVHLKAGDILFNPSYLWHNVENLTNSIAVKSSWVSLGTILKNPLMSFMTLSVMGTNLKRIRKELDGGKFFPKKSWL